MKKYITGLTALLTLAACSNDELVSSAENQKPGEEKEVNGISSQMVANYDMLDEEDMDTGIKGATRAGIDNDLNATWTVGDELSITNGTLMYSYNVNAVTNEGKSCTFTVVDGKTAHTSTNPDDAFYAIYPRRAVTEANGAGSWNGAVVKGQIFAQQSYAENMGKATDGNNFGGYYITTEKAKINNTDTETNLSFSFTPLASIVDVNLSSVELESGDQIAAVYLRDLSNKTIAANFSYNCSSKTLATTADGGCAYNYSSRSNVVEVNFFESENNDGSITYSALGSDKVVRFYILPVQLSAGVEITIRTVNGHYYTKKASSPVGDTEGCPFNSTDGDMAALVKPFYKKYNFGAIGTARKGAWMGCIPNNIFYTMLSIPGSHDAATKGASYLGVSAETQSWTIQQQLENGVRAFDLRPAGNSSTLEISHGSAMTGVTLSDAVETMHTYLTSNPTECVLAFIHMEQPTTGSVNASNATRWSNGVYNLVHTAVEGGYALDALGANTRFTDCRGKIVFVYRDDLTGDNKVYNACKVPWNDNIARTVNVQGTDGNSINGFLVSYQDIYNNDGAGTLSGNVAYDELAQKAGISSANAKAELVKKFIDSASGTTDARLILNFASWAGGALSSVSSNANTIMTAINPYIVSKHERVGIIFSDYVDKTYGGYNFVAVTLANNFKHVFTKRSRVDVMKMYNKNNGIGIDAAGDDYADEGAVYVKEQRNF